MDHDLRDQRDQIVVVYYKLIKFVCTRDIHFWFVDTKDYDHEDGLRDFRALRRYVNNLPKDLLPILQSREQQNVQSLPFEGWGHPRRQGAERRDEGVQTHFFAG